MLVGTQNKWGRGGTCTLQIEHLKMQCCVSVTLGLTAACRIQQDSTHNPAFLGLATIENRNKLLNCIPMLGRH